MQLPGLVAAMLPHVFMITQVAVKVMSCSSVNIHPVKQTTWVPPITVMQSGGWNDKLHLGRLTINCRRKAEHDVLLLSKHTTENPTEPRWFYHLGTAYADLGRHEDAVKAYFNCTNLQGWAEEGNVCGFQHSDRPRHEGKISAFKHATTTPNYTEHICMQVLGQC